MVIRIQAKEELIKSAKKDLLKFIKLGIISFAYVAFGSWLFYYIEHCYDVTPKQLKPSANELNNLCMNITKLQNETFLGDDRIAESLRRTCHLKQNEEEEEIKCEFTFKNFTKWCDYCFTIIYTIGKL